MRIASECLALVVACASSSCAIPAGMIPPATTTRVAEAPPRPLVATYDFRIVSEFEESEPSIATPSLQDRSVLVGALTQTRLFQEVRASEEPGEVHIRVRFVSKTTTSDNGPATAFTLGIIPSWKNTAYDLTAEALTPSGSLGSCRLHDECRVNYSSLCIPYALFRSPERVQREVRENLLRAAAQRLAASPEVRALAGVDSP